MKRARGFTLFELIVVLLILVILFVVLINILPSRSGQRRPHHQAMCMANLKGLSVALLLYTASNNDLYPTGADGTAAVSRTSGGYGYKDINTVTAADYNASNLLNYALLVEAGEVSYKTFKCPSCSGNAAKPPANQFGFSSANQVDYGLQPASGFKDANALGLAGQSSSMVIAGDKVRTDKDGKINTSAPSNNHNHRGRSWHNMLTLGGAVKYEKASPDTAPLWGVNDNDNIFTKDPNTDVPKQSDSELIWVGS